MKTLLLTGATGFLGSYLCKQLIGEYHIIATRRQTSNFKRLIGLSDKITWIDVAANSLKKAFYEHEIFTVIHCATQYGRKEVDNLETIEANMILPLRVLEICQKHSTKLFINTDTILDKRMSYYTFSKSQFKDWMKFCSSKLSCINMELEHFYGPYDDDSKFVTWLIHVLIKEEPQLELTQGEQTRNFIYVSDVVSAVQTILNQSSEFNKGFYNFQVGSDSETKIKELVTLIKELTGNQTTKLKFGSLPYRENEVMKVNIDTAPLRKLGWKEKVSLKEGLIKTITEEKNKGGN